MGEPLRLVGSRYRLQVLIGQGGMGKVWRAWDDVLARPVAVKMLHPGLARAPEVQQRLRAEAQLSATVRHPGLAAVYDYGTEDASPYVVMELIEGTALSAILDRDGPLPPAQVGDVITQVADTLTAVHAAGIIHRDVKSANLLLTPAGQVVLTDFGIARALGTAGLTGTGLRIGSPPYMSPEHVSGDPVGPASDVYSLGITAYELLTGTRPFTGEPIAVALKQRDSSPPPLPATVPDPVRGLVMAMLAKNPTSRPTTTQLGTRPEPVTTDVHAVTARLDRPADPDSAAPHGARRRRRRHKRAAVSTAALALAIAAGIILTATTPPSTTRPDPAVASPVPSRSTQPLPSTPPAIHRAARSTAGRAPGTQPSTAQHTAAAIVDHSTTPPPRTTATLQTHGTPRHIHKTVPPAPPKKAHPKTHPPPHPKPPHQKKNSPGQHRSGPAGR